MTEPQLAEPRNRIKEIDREIVRLLNQRAKLAMEIGKIKAEMGVEVYDPAQESKIYENVTEANGDDIPHKSMRAIFREIISASRVLQHPVTVAYFGLESSFSHIAARTHFGTSSQYFSHSTIASVFDDVEKGRVQWGVVPVENSLEGSVNLTLDRLLTTILRIRAEIFLRITQCLLSPHELLEDVKTIYSHPQPLAQCQGWLRANLPNATVIEMESTTAAAQRAADEGKGASIGSSAAAGTYGLNILAEAIEDKTSNTTRFLIIGEGESEYTGNDKTSLLFATSHMPGALYHAL